MSKNEENNRQIMPKNNSTHILKQHFHHKINSSNFLTESPSPLITVQLNSLNNNKNSKNKNEQNINQNHKNHSITNKNDVNIEKNSFQDMNNIRLKLSKISSQFSANTPKQLANIYNQLCGKRMDPSNIVVKKNLKLEIKDLQKNKKNNGYKSERNTKINNEFVKYVNNDKSHFNGNLLNMNHNHKNFILSQSKSLINMNKTEMNNGLNTPNNKSFNNKNLKNVKIIQNKKLGLTLLTKSTNNIYGDHYSKNIKDNNEMNTSKSQNEFFHNNNNNTNNKHFEGDKKCIEDNVINNNKKIYFMRPVYKRKKSINNNKSIENSNINTNQSSICSRNKNFFDENILNDFLNNNIENPEELHFFYVKIIQKSHEISQKFEFD